MVIRTNVSSLRVYNAGRLTKTALSKNLEKLSTGYRINRAADDAAGLGVSERIRAKVTELDRAQRNASEGMDLARTADAALQEINDMLKRARGLCIQAENGTYGDQELTAISGEMNQLFQEIDRITAGSCYNTIRLFRQGVGVTYHEEVIEQYTPVGEDLQIWGGLDFIEKDVFDRASAATPATATFELDDSIDPNDPSTMEGKALTIGSRTYYFTKGNTLPSVGYPSPTRVAIGGTVEATLENLVKASPDISGASISGRNVTLTASLKDLKYRLNNVPYTAAEGDAEWAHSLTVTSPTGKEPLSAIDGTDASDNQPAYTMPSTSVKLLYTLPKGGITKISDEDITNLKENKFHLYLVENDSTSTVTVSLGDLDLGGAVTQWGQFGNALKSAIESKVDTNKYTVTFSGKRLTITYKLGNRNSCTYLYTDVETGRISSGTGSQTLKTWTSQGVSGFKVTQDAWGSAEKQEHCTVEIPELSGKTLPISFSVNGRSHLFYNPSDPEYTAFTGQSGVSLNTSATYDHRVSSVTSDSVASAIESFVELALGNATVTVSGNKLLIEAQNTGTMDTIYKKLQTMFGSTTCTIKAVKGGTGSTYSKPVLSDERVYSTAIPKATVTFNLGSDPKNLEGKGFSVDGTRVEFINSENGGSLRDDYYNDIDLKTVDTLEKVREAVANRFGSGYTVTLSGTKLSIAVNTRSKISVTDGISGMGQLSKGGQVQFDGGVNTGHSQKAIDFSSINEDNLDTLMGKGFRINCATCPGEYINIFFCWKDDSSRPRTFQKLDPTMGEMRTIHNISVELSKVTSGDKIVENIVEQVRPSLNHFTDLMVGDPPTVLLAMEKRIGDVIFDNELKLGSVETGMEANFTYSIERKMVADLPKGDLKELETATVNIYVGSDPEPQIIPIHLPYIDLYHLRMSPPESVDLTAEDQDPADWLERIDRADLAISSARGTIGADYNRLEHAIQDLSNAHIQLTDAYSVIRDADMAELMKEEIKLQILMQAQQSMQAQANQMPQGVLQLLQ